MYRYTLCINSYTIWLYLIMLYVASYSYSYHNSIIICMHAELSYLSAPSYNVHDCIANEEKFISHLVACFNDPGIHILLTRFSHMN